MIYMLAASLLLLTVLVLVIIITNASKWNSLAVMVIVPFLLFNIGFSWYTIDEMWGQAKEGLPEHKVFVLHAYVEKPWIFVTIKDKEDIRLRKIPYTKSNQKKMSEATEKLKTGKKVQVQMFRNKIDSIAEIKVYDWDYLVDMPKE